MAEQRKCPSCGTVSWFEEIRRGADEFCRECDYPLFWARGNEPTRSAYSDEDPEVRRLPGTARVAVVTQECWSCRKPNPQTATVCVHCGSDLSGPPAPAPAPPPVTVVVEAPPPPPPPPAPSIWPWVVLAVLFVLGLVLLLVLL